MDDKGCQTVCMHNAQAPTLWYLLNGVFIEQTYMKGSNVFILANSAHMNVQVFKVL